MEKHSILLAVRRVNLYLKTGDWQKLKSISKRTGVPTSAIVRKIIADYLKKKSK